MRLPAGIDQGQHRQQKVHRPQVEDAGGSVHGPHREIHFAVGVKHDRIERGRLAGKLEVETEEAARSLRSIQPTGENAVVEVVDVRTGLEVDLGRGGVIRERKPERSARQIDLGRTQVELPVDDLNAQQPVGQVVVAREHLCHCHVEVGIDAP